MKIKMGDYVKIEGSLGRVGIVMYIIDMGKFIPTTKSEVYYKLYNADNTLYTKDKLKKITEEDYNEACW